MLHPEIADFWMETNHRAHPMDTRKERTEPSLRSRKGNASRPKGEEADSPSTGGIGEARKRAALSAALNLSPSLALLREACVDVTLREQPGEEKEV